MMQRIPHPVLGPLGVKPAATRLVVSDALGSALSHVALCRGAGTVFMLARTEAESTEDFAERVAARLADDDLLDQRIDRAVFVLDGGGSGGDEIAARSIVAALLVGAIGRSGGGALFLAGRTRDTRDATAEIARFAIDVANEMNAPVDVRVLGDLRLVERASDDEPASEATS